MPRTDDLLAVESKYVPSLLGFLLIFYFAFSCYIFLVFSKASYYLLFSFLSRLWYFLIFISFSFLEEVPRIDAKKLVDTIESVPFVSSCSGINYAVLRRSSFLYCRWWRVLVISIELVSYSLTRCYSSRASKLRISVPVTDVEMS